MFVYRPLSQARLHTSTQRTLFMQRLSTIEVKIELKLDSRCYWALSLWYIILKLKCKIYCVMRSKTSVSKKHDMSTFKICSFNCNLMKQVWQGPELVEVLWLSAMEMLNTNADIVQAIPTQEKVTMAMFISAQSWVARALHDNW